MVLKRDVEGSHFVWVRDMRWLPLLSEPSRSEFVAEVDLGKERVMMNIYLGISRVTRAVATTANRGQHMANKNG